MNVQTHEEVARNAAEISQDAARVSTSAAKVAADQEFQATRERAAELAAEAKAKGTAAFEPPAHHLIKLLRKITFLPAVLLLSVPACHIWRDSFIKCSLL